MDTEICFSSYYDAVQGNFYTNAETYTREKDPKYFLKDCYEVKIIQNNQTGEFIAIEAGRIKKFAEDNGSSKFNFHVNPCDDLCVAPKNTEHYRKYSRSKNEFIDKLLIPALYSHSFYELHNKRPWPDYGHDQIGNFEAYYREDTPDSEEKTIRNLLYLKGIGFPIKSLAKKDDSFLERLRDKSEEASRGATKLAADIERFKLGEYLK